MCGLFGAAGHSINPQIVRTLAVLNESRGRDSMGLFNSSSKMVKMALAPTKCLWKPEFNEFFKRDTWFIAGHTRAKTRGEVKTANAHPFRYGDIIGAHNGIVTPHNLDDYEVDSMAIFEGLHKCEGDYQEALGKMPGYFAVEWFDGTNLYFLGHNNSLSIAIHNSNFYWSSSEDHLKTAIGTWDYMESICNDRVVSVGEDMKLKSLPYLDHTFVYGCGSHYSCGYNSSSVDKEDEDQGPTTELGRKIAARLTDDNDEAVEWWNESGGYETDSLIERSLDLDSRVERAVAGRIGDGKWCRSGELSPKEYMYSDALAINLGYAGLYEFMRYLDMDDESEATDLLVHEADSMGVKYGTNLFPDDPPDEEETEIVGADALACFMGYASFQDYMLQNGWEDRTVAYEKLVAKADQ